MTPSERRLCDWQYADGNDEGFYTLLFRLMARADEDNLVNTEKGFPAEAMAFRLFRSDKRYWPKLEEEYLRKEVIE